VGHPFQGGFDLQLRPDRIDQPQRWKRSRVIFVNSMSDLFHKDVPTEFVDRVFDTMEAADWHVFQLLTKRSTLMMRYLNRRFAQRECPPHIWCGVSVEDAPAKSRVEHLRRSRASIRFLSIEPLIGPVGPLDLGGIHWVIVGGESGPGSRPMKLEWATSVRDQCKQQGVPFFFKQWGQFGADGISRGKKKNGRTLEGHLHDAMPSYAQ
jgi:protein gp37